MDQKTLDRWRLAFDAFKNLIRVTGEIGTECPHLINVRLTALYALSKPGVSDDHRRQALLLAESGVIVTQQLAALLTSPIGSSGRQCGEKMHRKVITLPSGTISIHVNHEDFGVALFCRSAAP
jgi:hypothetical protein